MAKKTVVATLGKRDKKRPLAYIDRAGNARHFRRGQKKRQHAILAKKVVSQELLKARRALKVVLYIKGRKVMKTKSALSNRKIRRRKGRGRR